LTAFLEMGEKIKTSEISEILETICAQNELEWRKLNVRLIPTIKVTEAGENCSWTRIRSIVLRHRLSRRLISPKQIFDWSRAN